MRDTLAPVTARDLHLKVRGPSATTGSILREDHRGDVLRETAAAHEGAAHDPEVS
ncbi:hypothetical protein ACFXEL_23715 [Streptomyces sp. NPDC059382]|uniref:hypothetical protein n=1 Tax=Streptomyces sp. NPDC059382 TaxID=3346816 RepID=UPI0036C0139A